MATKASKNTLTEEMLARQQQIKVILSRADDQEFELAKDKSAEAAQRRLNLQYVRLELYNKQAQINNDLIHLGVKSPTKEGEKRILALARDFNLAARLKQHRAGGVIEGDCTTRCTVCISACTECVTKCTECVASVSGCAGNSLSAGGCKPAVDVVGQRPTLAV